MNERMNLEQKNRTHFSLYEMLFPLLGNAE